MTKLLCLSLLLMAPVAAQHPQWVQDLGDPDRGDAAERALVEAGAQGLPALVELLEAHRRGDDERAVERVRAALRVVAVLGADAAEASAALQLMAKDIDRRILIELTHARGSLVPYETDQEWHDVFHAAVHELDVEAKGRLMRELARHAARLQLSADALDTLLGELVQDAIFRREIVAERLGRLGDPRAIDPLVARLRDRETRPRGWDQLKFNGFVVPIDDDFRWRAGEALLRIDPDDMRCAIAWGMRARWHPVRGLRLAALRSLTRFGPATVDALPELVEIAAGDDAQLAAEALKVLGMAGPQVGEHLLAIDALAAGEDATIARLAGSLAARLCAMGAVAPPIDPAPRQRAELRALIAGIDDDEIDAATEAALAADDAVTLELLLERVRDERGDCPRPVVARIVALAERRGESERHDVREKLRQRFGERWSASMMSTSSGGGGGGRKDTLDYGRLTVGYPADVAALAPFLVFEKNAFVRLAAARQLAARRAEVVGKAELVTALLVAARVAHPDKSMFESENTTEEQPSDVDDAIHAAAAAALAACEVPEADRGELLRKALAHDDPAAVSAAIAGWAGPAQLDVLVAALKGDPVVAIAAAQAIGRLGAAGKGAEAALGRAAKSGFADLAAAAQAALEQVRGGG